MKQFEAYCVKCRAKQMMKDPKEDTIEGKGGKRNVLRGKCPKCGTNMFKFVATKKAK